MHLLPVMSVSQLVCGYQMDKPLTPALSFDIEPNDIVAILGVNGRGKSTLLQTLLGIQPPLSGTVMTECALSFVPQFFSSPFHYSVLDLVLMGKAKQLGLFGRPDKKAIAQALDNLALLGMQQYAEKAFSHLSGGQKQLVLMARALTSDCQILLLDEPTSALDLHNQKQVLNILNDLAKERHLTILFSTHDPAQAMAIANKVLLLDGQDYLFGQADELLTEQHLSQLYQITMRKITLARHAKTDNCDQSSSNQPLHTIVPLYREE
ncbi:ABC transporter ATP-binding protein [Orbaceae bacterium ESL0727]|nr:ABC transporter ATP-binding protein [Orbaceae bacterium ESL0727]